VNRRSLSAVAVAAGLVAGVLLVDTVAPPPTPDVAEDGPAEAAPGDSVAGSAVCAVGDGRDGSDLAVTAARPGAVGDEPAVAALTTFEDGEVAVTSLPSLFPGVHVRRSPDGGDAMATTVDWQDAPVAVSREWRIGGGLLDEVEDAEDADDAAEDGTDEPAAEADGTDEADEPADADTEEAEDADADEADEEAATGTAVVEEAGPLPPGTVAGPCPTTLSDRWVFPGMVTVGGSQAVLRIANPFGTDATVAVGFVTPEGPEEPIALQNLSVSAGSTLEVDVNEVLPERADLAAVVRVLSGRAVAEGYQLTRPEIGDIAGASLLAGSTVAATTWTVPWVLDGDEDQSWLWVLNLGDRPAPVELTLHTDDGGLPPEGLSELTVAPGQLRRIDLRGTLPEGTSDVAVTARSDGAPIHVAGAVQRPADDPARTGFAVQLGVPEPDSTWVLAGGPIEGDRTEALIVSNPGSEPAAVSVRLFNGATSVEPERLREVEIGPGGIVRLGIRDDLADAPSWSAVVTSEGTPVVAGRVGSRGEDGNHLVVVPGTPANAWSVNGSGLEGRATPGAVQRLGTGVAPAAPAAPDADG
jgi:hypothetical protein